LKNHKYVISLNSNYTARPYTKWFGWFSFSLTYVYFPLNFSCYIISPF
jgi:hypothetical protein